MENHFGADVARTYDAGTDLEAVARTVATLRVLAAGGRALEFAVGTGRIALPLAQAGVEVAGIELSAESLRGSYALAQPSSDADLQRVVALAETTPAQ